MRIGLVSYSYFLGHLKELQKDNRDFSGMSREEAYIELLKSHLARLLTLARNKNSSKDLIYETMCSVRELSEFIFIPIKDKPSYPYFALFCMAGEIKVMELTLSMINAKEEEREIWLKKTFGRIVFLPKLKRRRDENRTN